MRDVPIRFGADKTPIEVICAFFPDKPMQEKLNSMEIAEAIRNEFSMATPLLLSNDMESIKFELKPYLQPSERELAMRELRSLIDSNDRIVEEQGYCLINTDRSEKFFLQRLTYWQRVGRVFLEPTIQGVA